MTRRRVSLFWFVYLVIGLIVAHNRNYLTGWNDVGNAVEGLLAIFLWPLVWLGNLDLTKLFDNPLQSGPQ